MTRDHYELFPVFAIRLAGAPFELLERLETRESNRLARRTIEQEDALRAHAKELLAALRAAPASLPAGDLHRARTKIGQAQAIPAFVAETLPAGRAYAEAHAVLERTRAELSRALDREVAAARRSLGDSAASILRRFLVFSSGGINEAVEAEASAVTGGGTGNSKDRQRYEALALYLQRICAKNDTISEFGPVGWGTVSPIGQRMRIAPRPGIVRRETYVERWVVDVLASILDADPDVRPELAPRLHPDGRLEGDRFIREDKDTERALDPEAVEVLRRCDGATPAHVIGHREKLEELARHEVVIWAVEPLAFDAHRADALAEQIRAWRDGPARRRWLPVVDGLLAFARRFAVETDPDERVAIMDEARAKVVECGGEAKASSRALYTATNPIGEDCVRECGFELGAAAADELARDAAPWFDLWRDTFNFVAWRVGQKVRELYECAPRRRGRVSLPSFLRHCAQRGVDIEGLGIVLLARAAFREVNEVFRVEVCAGRDAAAAEWELTAGDCSVLRRRFEFPTFNEFTWPSADVQIAASSPETFARGEREWVIGELHNDMVLLQHCFFHSCPAPELLREAFRRLTAGRTLGLLTSGYDPACHITLHYCEAYGDRLRFLETKTRVRATHGAIALRPAMAEVHLDEAMADVRIKATESGEDLGSFARGWWIGAGFHPFVFPLGAHAPRLRLGKVIVQRQSWTVSADALLASDGTARSTCLAVERLRSERGWPRHVYIRPTPEALARAGKSWDKDVKPIFVDFESFVFSRIFHRWLLKHGELEVSEMLPRADQLVWREADGSRSFELRALVMPRERG